MKLSKFSLLLLMLIISGCGTTIEYRYLNHTVNNTIIVNQTCASVPVCEDCAATNQNLRKLYLEALRKVSELQENLSNVLGCKMKQSSIRSYAENGYLMANVSVNDTAMILESYGNFTAMHEPNYIRVLDKINTIQVNLQGIRSKFRDIAGYDMAGLR